MSQDHFEQVLRRNILSRSIAGSLRNQEIPDLTLVCKDGQLVETHVSLLAILSKELSEVFTSLPWLAGLTSWLAEACRECWSWAARPGGALARYQGTAVGVLEMVETLLRLLRLLLTLDLVPGAGGWLALLTRLAVSSPRWGSRALVEPLLSQNIYSNMVRPNAADLPPAM